MGADKSVLKINDLQKLRFLVTQDENGLEEFLYPKLRIGDTWWIPDEISGFGTKERHPWVIVKPYSITATSVIACPRTSTDSNVRKLGGIQTPAYILPSLDKSGFLILMHRRAFPVSNFREFVYIGQLSEEWLRRIQKFYHSLTKGKVT